MTSKPLEHVADIEKSLRHIAAIIKQKDEKSLTNMRLRRRNLSACNGFMN